MNMCVWSDLLILNPRFKDCFFCPTSHPWFGWFAFVEGSMGFGGKPVSPVFLFPKTFPLAFYTIVSIVSVVFFGYGTPGEFPGVFV